MNDVIVQVREILLERIQTLENPHDIVKSPELKQLLASIRDVAPQDRAAYGQAVNALKVELEARVAELRTPTSELRPIDVTAPMDVNAPLPQLLPASGGSIHPLMSEIAVVSDIFARMGSDKNRVKLMINITCLSHSIFLKDIRHATITTPL